MGAVSVYFGAILLLLVVVVVVGMTNNETEWLPTEDSGCYLRVHYDRSLFGDDVTTRQRFCWRCA